MSGLLLRARNLVQPLHNAAVDDYWQRRKPRSIYLPTSLRPGDVMRQYPVTDTTSTAVMNTGAVGRVWDFGAGSATSRILTPSGSINSIGGVTIVAVIRPTSFAALSSICSSLSSALNGLQFRITLGGNLEAVCAGVVVLSTDTAALTVNRWSTVALRILTGTGARSTFATNGIIGASPATDATATMNGAGAIGERYTGSSQPFVGQMALLAQFDTRFSDADLRSITAQPWQMLKPPGRRIWVGASSGSDVTVALTGVSATASAGTLAPSNSKAITGTAATAAAGTLAPSNSKAVTGNAATGAAGTVAPSASIGITGNAATAAAGTLAPSVSVSLTGNAGTSAVGTVSPSVGVTVALTGVAASASAGNVAPATSIGLTGNAGTGAVGTVTPSVGVTIALTGVSATASAGNIAPATSKAVTGNAASGGLGTVVPGTSRAITGNAATSALASLAPSVTLGLSGNAGSGAVGTINIAGSSFAALTGVEAAGAVGSVTARVDALLGPRPGGPRGTGNARPTASTASRPSATTRSRSANR